GGRIDARAGSRAGRWHACGARSRAGMDGAAGRRVMDFGLKGKVAMVAGASRGLGYAVAKALAAEGVRVSVASRPGQAHCDAADRMESETHAETLGTALDVKSADSLAAWHGRTIEKFGGVDLLFVNAGGPPAGTTLSFDDATWQ